MKYSDVFKFKDSDDSVDSYCSDFNENNPAKPIIVEGEYYVLKNSEYKCLEGIAKQAGIKMEELKTFHNSSFEAGIRISIKDESIERLEIYKCSLENMPCFKDLNKLKYLDLWYSGLKKIEGLESLTSLEKLTLVYSGIEKIEGLDSLINLKELSLSNNSISKIEGLDCLVNLEGLYLHENSISKIEGLDKLSKLKKMSYDKKKIPYAEHLELQALLKSRNKKSRLKK